MIDKISSQRVLTKGKEPGYEASKNNSKHQKAKSISFINQKTNFSRTSHHDLESLLSYVKSNAKQTDSSSKPNTKENKDTFKMVVEEQMKRNSFRKSLNTSLTGFSKSQSRQQLSTAISTTVKRRNKSPSSER